VTPAIDVQQRGLVLVLVLFAIYVVIRVLG
jgi:hypothetical protein